MGPPATGPGLADLQTDGTDRAPPAVQGALLTLELHLEVSSVDTQF